MRQRVLVIEDEPLYREKIARYLEGAGFDVLRAGNADHALEALKEGPLDCVVADYMLPGVNGLEFVKLLRTVDKKTAVVIMTAHDARKVEKECEGLRVWSVLRKPFSMTALATKVADAVELTHLSPEKEEALAVKFDEEATRMRTLRQDLLDETRRWPPDWQERAKGQ